MPRRQFDNGGRGCDAFGDSPALAEYFLKRAALAKRQLYLTISELFKRFPNVELAEEPEKDAGDHNAIVFKQLLLKTNCS